MTATAPRICPMCMYRYALPGYKTRPLCGLTHGLLPEANTCAKWQIGHAGKQYEAEQAQQERAERERRRQAEPVQLELFEDGSNG